MTDTVLVRAAEAADIPALAAAEPEGADIAVRIFARQQRGESVFLLAWVGGAVVGTGELVLGDEPELRSLHVAQDRRGQGIGTAMIRAAERYPNGERLTMWVGLENPAARRLYERLGYAGTGAQKTTTYTYVDDDGPHEATEVDEQMVRSRTP